MAPIQIPDTCEFELEHDQIELKTRANGDFIEITGINLEALQSASLAYLLNKHATLSIEVKEKTP